MSIASIHSETVNIWTHLIGALCMAVTYTLFLVENHRQMDLSDFISFSVFFISAILCLTFSTLLHVFINYSPRVLVTVSKLDYMGRLNMQNWHIFMYTSGNISAFIA
jgi:adiponectin receptor